MNDKVVSLSGWKSNRNKTPDAPSKPKGQGNFEIGGSLLETIVKSFADVTTKDGDTPFSFLGLGLVLRQRLSQIDFSKNPRKVAEARNLARSYDDAQLSALMRNATDQELRLRPSFYYGLVEEADSRL